MEKDFGKVFIIKKIAIIWNKTRKILNKIQEIFEKKSKILNKIFQEFT